MYISAFFMALRRRWYVFALGLAATVGLCVLALQVVPPSYEVKGSTLLLPPDDIVGDGGNPYLSLGSLDQVVDVVVKYVDSDVQREAIAQQVPTAAYMVARDETTNGPVITATVEDSTAEGALDAAGLVLDSIPSALAELQESVGVEPGADVTSMILAMDNEATTVSKASVRAVIAAAGVGLVAAAMSTAMFDGLLRSFQARRSGRTTAPADRRGRRAAVAVASDDPNDSRIEEEAADALEASLAPEPEDALSAANETSGRAVATLGRRSGRGSGSVDVVAGRRRNRFT